MTLKTRIVLIVLSSIFAAGIALYSYFLIPTTSAVASAVWGS